MCAGMTSSVPRERKRYAWTAGVLALAFACGSTRAPPPPSEISSIPFGDDVAYRSAPPLESWTDGPTKAAILDFVRRVTTEGSPDFVPPEERIATFDNDGTLWVEKPIYVQAEFVFDRVAALAPEHPEWSDQEPFKSILAGHIKDVTTEEAMRLLAATLSGMTTEVFETQVKDWLASDRDARFGRLHTELVYEPMIELLHHLRANGFKTYIVTGGGADFVRPFAGHAYGIPPEGVVGSRLAVAYEGADAGPALVRQPKIEFIDDGPGKPVGIHQMIGRRPIAAFGNSDGDFEMLEWTTAAPGPRLGLIVHHTDAEREWSYDRESTVGKLSRGLDAAANHGWIVVDMKRDWKVVFPFEMQSSAR